MTKEEQIDWLCRLRADLNNGVIFTPWNKEFTEALNDVLEQEAILNKPHIKGDYYDGFKNGLRTAEWRYDKIRAEIWDLQYGPEEKSMTDEDRADAYNNAIIQTIGIIDKYNPKSEG